MNASSEYRTLVFLGPSLPLKEASEIFPEAWFHAPAKCGDILKAIRLSPHRIAIIDGYFEQTASLWHKEILFALSLGIEVFGASSMGALRALELEPYGMQGFGKIFQFLKETQSPNDDEVCLAHSQDFSAQTPPLCNIRATLDHAFLAQLLDEQEKKESLQALQALPYYQRSFTHLSGKTALIKFCLSHYVDQKREDSIALLSYLRANPITLVKSIPTFSPTLFFYKIFREISATPFDHNYSWLPVLEKKAFAASQQAYSSAQKRLSKLFHLCYDLARTQKVTVPNEESILEWARKINLDYPLKISNARLNQYLDLYDPCMALNPRIQDLTLILFKSLLGSLTKMDLKFYPEVYQRFSNHFRQKHHLSNQAQTLDWIKSKNLALLEPPNEETETLSQVFNEFVEYLSPLYFLIDLNNGHALGVSPSLAAIPWLKFSEAEVSSLDRFSMV